MRILKSNMKSVYRKTFLVLSIGYIFIIIFSLLLYVYNRKNITLIGINLFLDGLIFIAVYISLRLVIRSRFNRISNEIRAQERVSSALIGLLHSTGGIANLKTYNQLLTSNINNPEMVEELLVQEALLIDEYSERTKSLISDISGSFKFERQRTDLNELVEQSVNFIKAKRIRDKKVHIHFDKFCKPLFSSVSPSEVKTALENILDNSFDELILSKNENKTVSISVEESQGSVAISITDNGRGIAGQEGQVDLNYFKPGKSTKINGNGLGVYTSINSIINNGGTIGIFSSSSGLETLVRFPGE